MKKITLFAMMALFSFGLSAQTMHRKVDVQSMCKLSVITPNRVAKAEDISVITDTPAGERKRYIRTGQNFEYNVQAQTIDEGEQFGPIVIVFAEDGSTVYLQNPVSGFGVGSWVKATKEGNKITLPLNQNVFYSNNYSTNVKIGVLKADASVGYKLDTATESVTYTVTDETIALDALPDGAILGVYWNDDKSWASCGDVNSVYTISNEKPLVVPEGLELKDYTLDAKQYEDDPIKGAKTKVGVKGNEVYVQGLFTVMPEAWVKGTKEGSTVTFKTGQWMGDAESGDAIYLVALNGEEIGDVVYTYDEAKDVYTQQSSYVVFTVKPDAVLFYAAYETSTLNGGTNSVDAAVADARQAGVAAYYDMQGRHVMSPVAGGLYVKTTTYADGSKKSEKTVVR